MNMYMRLWFSNTRFASGVRWLSGWTKKTSMLVARMLYSFLNWARGFRLLKLLVFFLALFWTIVVWMPLWRPALSGIDIPDVTAGSSKSYLVIGGLCIVGALVIAVTIVICVLILQSYMNRDSKERETDASKDGEEKSDWGFARFGKKIYEWRNHPLAFILWVSVGWFGAMGILWLFKEPMSNLGWPRNGVSAYQWIREENRELFWFTPIPIILGIWFLHAKSKILKFIGVLFWLPLIVLWAVTISRVTEKSEAWIDYRASRERGYEAEKAARGHEVYIVTAENDRWSDPICIPLGKNFRCDVDWQSEDDCLLVSANGGRTFEYHCGASELKIGKNIKTLRFKTYSGKTPLKVTVSIR